MARRVWSAVAVLLFSACGDDGSGSTPGAGGDGASSGTGNGPQAGSGSEAMAGAGASDAEGGAGTMAMGGGASAGTSAGEAGAPPLIACDEAACQNGGTCPADGGTSCECPDAFTGALCELPRFELLEAPTGATTASTIALSAAGDVAIGNSATPAGAVAFRWTHEGGVVPFDALQGDTGTTVIALSRNGRVAVGQSGTAKEAVYWTAGQAEPLSLMSTAWESLLPLYVSEDGSVIAGTGALPGGELAAFRWTKAAGPVALGDFDAPASLSVVGMSSDGSVIVGNSGKAATVTGFVWSSAGGAPELVPLPALQGDARTSALALSGDGATIVGDSLSDATSRRVRWLDGSDPELLDPADLGTAWGCGGGPFSKCGGVSDDGSLIYTQRAGIAQRFTEAAGIEPLSLVANKGNCMVIPSALPVLELVAGNCIGPPVAVVWDVERKAARLDDTLADFGVAAPELTNATITVVRAVSANADTILGDNFNTTVLWIARVAP